jgi:hypothetical protein
MGNKNNRPQRETSLPAVTRNQDRKDQIAAELVLKLEEWVTVENPRAIGGKSTSVMWRSELEVCDILGIQRELSFGDNNTIQRKALLSDQNEPDKCILVYNLLKFPVCVSSEFLPGTRRLLKSLTLGLNASATGGGANFGYEVEQEKIQAINLEKMVVFPGQIALIQVGSRIQSFLSVDVLYEGSQINLYTDKKMYYSQALVIGGDGLNPAINNLAATPAAVDYNTHFVSSFPLLSQSFSYCTVGSSQATCR